MWVEEILLGRDNSVFWGRAGVGGGGGGGGGLRALFKYWRLHGEDRGSC